MCSHVCVFLPGLTECVSSHSDNRKVFVIDYYVSSKACVQEITSWWKAVTTSNMFEYNISLLGLRNRKDKPVMKKRIYVCVNRSQIGVLSYSRPLS